MTTEKELELVKKRQNATEDCICYLLSVVDGLYATVLKMALAKPDGGKLADLLISKNDKPRCCPQELDDELPPPHKFRKSQLSKEDAEDRIRLMSSPLQVENALLRRLAKLQEKQAKSQTQQGAGGMVL